MWPTVAAGAPTTCAAAGRLAVATPPGPGCRLWMTAGAAACWTWPPRGSGACTGRRGSAAPALPPRGLWCGAQRPVWCGFLGSSATLGRGRALSSAAGRVGRGVAAARPGSACVRGLLCVWASVCFPTDRGPSVTPFRAVVGCGGGLGWDQQRASWREEGEGDAPGGASQLCSFRRGHRFPPSRQCRFTTAPTPPLQALSCRSFTPRRLPPAGSAGVVPLLPHLVEQQGSRLRQRRR